MVLHALKAFQATLHQFLFALTLFNHHPFLINNNQALFDNTSLHLQLTETCIQPMKTTYQH